VSGPMRVTGGNVLPNWPARAKAGDIGFPLEQQSDTNEMV